MAPITPERLSIAQLPTPLEPLDRLSAAIGGPRLWVKRDDLTGSDLSGNKVRKLEYVIAEAKAQGCDRLITCGGLQSNHCRATAIAGRRLGFRVHLVLRGKPDGAPQGNLFLDHLAGAKVHTYPPDEYRARRDEIFEEIAAKCASKGHKAYKIPTGASDETGIWGYIHACEELKRDFAAAGITKPAIVTATGSGGTQAGLTVGNALHGLGAEVFGINVCDDEETFVKKVGEDAHGWREKYGHSLDVGSLAINVLDGHVGPGYAQATPEIRETIKRVARTEGLILDPVYSGKAFHGLLEEIAAGRFDSTEHIVFIHTGGVYGLLAQAETFEFA